MAALRLLAATALLFGGAPVAAGGPRPLPVKQAPARDGICSFSGWSTDRDPAGLNVRAGPSANARIVGPLPPPEREPGEERDFAVGFDVLEARDGWFRIANAERWGARQPANPPLPSGWISGRYLGFHIQSDIAFAEPDPESRRVATSWRDRDGGGQHMRHRNPSACRGEWVRLSITGMDGIEREAWVRGVCGNQETTCDGVPADYLRYEDMPQRR